MNSCEADSSLFVKRVEEDILILLLYVDEDLIGSSNEKLSVVLINHLEKEFEITKTNNFNSYLGIEIKSEGNRIVICHTKYIKKIISQFRLEDASIQKAPIRPGWDNMNSKSFENNTLYRELVGSFIYLAGVSRPDISFAVNMLLIMEANMNREDQLVD